ncbi:MAG: hypothetical protein U0Q16_29805 [Bryobacteraceae bacterium]
MLRCLTILLGVAIALHAETGKFLGTWSCTATTPNGDEVPWTLELAQPDGKLKVSIKSERGDLAVPDARMDGDTLSFDVTVGEGKFHIELRFEGDKVKGSWKGGDDSGTMKGTRK